MQSLLFFNKEGDNLNFKWDSINEQWTGDLLFNENSNDVFKTIGIYTFEKIPSFEYENVGNLKLDKFQLFNEYKFNIYGCSSSFMTQSVLKIETVNEDVNFYSKWVWGINFDTMYPIGSQIRFNEHIYEFNDINTTYTVVQTKKNAILIITTINNKVFNSTFTNIGETLSNITLSGVNSIGIYNFIDQNYNNQFSSWSEPDFYSKYYNGKRLTLVNTQKNDKIVTINNLTLSDKMYYRYVLGLDSITTEDGLTLELVLKTDIPTIYKGDIEVNPTSYPSNSVLFSDGIPNILKPNSEFVIKNSVLNSNNIVVDSIPKFLSNTNTTYYATYSQVLYNNRIWECRKAYTWSATSEIIPGSTYSNWTYSNFIVANTTLYNESFLSTEVSLTTNKIKYYQSYTQSNTITYASAVENFKDYFNFYNIDLYYKDRSLNADLYYPSDYASVNFYSGLTGSSNLGSVKRVYERNVGISEFLTTELNTNTNENFSYNIVFTDLDEYGLNLKINGQEYQQEIDWIYSGLTVDMARTIDRTLRLWLVKWYVDLNKIGIIPSLHFVGNYNSIYFNSITLKTEYPNVPLDFKVLVGTTADFYIEHSEIIFIDSSNYLILDINGRSYGQTVSTVSGTSSYDISTAISIWVDTYSDELNGYGIYTESVNNMLIFKVKEPKQRLDYTISVGKSSLPGVDLYKVYNKIKGKFGGLIVSNELVLPVDGTYSFENDQFATGQIVGINNTYRPYDNQEYNILYLEPTHIVLSYQGPFWGTTDPRCDVGPFVTLAFNGGFSATACLPPITPPLIPAGGGQFAAQSFTSSFSLKWVSTNFYSESQTILTDDNMVDIMYLQLTSCIYIMGDKLTVIDGYNKSVINVVDIGASNGLKAVYNPINNFIYYLTDTVLWVLDPTSPATFAPTPVILYNQTVKSQITVTNPLDISVNPLNGDIYLTSVSSPTINIWSSTNLTSVPTATFNAAYNALKMTFNEFEEDMYVTTNGDYVLRVNGNSRTLQTSYNVTSLIDVIFYEPISSSIFVFGSVLTIINNGVITTEPLISVKLFNDLLFNNTTGDVVISQTDLFAKLQYGGTPDGFGMVNSGYLSISQYDGDVYIASQTSNQYFVIDTINLVIKHNGSLTSKMKKIIYDPDRQTMIGIQPMDKKLIEITVTLTSSIDINPVTYSVVDDSSYGTLDPNHKPHTDVWLKTREYLRKPRENYNGDPQVSMAWKWETDQYPQMFLYDFSGNQLSSTGSYVYSGPKPLPEVHLNRVPNKDLTKLDDSTFQQTIFSEITEQLDYIDSNTNLSIVPEPMEIFIGFKSDDEGPMKSNLMLYQRYDIDFTITTTSLNMDIIQFSLLVDEYGKRYGQIAINTNSTSYFTKDSNDNNRGLKVGQWIKLFIKDVSNSKNKYISFNNGKVFKIRNVYTRYIIVDFINDEMYNEFSQIDDYPTTGKTTYMSVRFKVIDKPIGKFSVYGQTEIEDIRYKIELSNVGHNVDPQDAFIFKSYDVNEEGVDWVFLNKKRKEMMMVRHDIFPYIGSYKSIINAINFFGYNDLELYEYYRNINVNSPDFFKLFKVEIPDIFDNTVEGWTVNDFLKHTMPNPNYEDTNLFNLTYKITDKEGNNLLTYSLREVLIKLQGLKYWLQRNIIPITHRILDITGRADFVGTNVIQHRNFDAKILNIRQEMTPVDFELNEAYLMPINSGSTVYTCHIDFITATSSIPDYFNLKIRTYKTYKEWNPFTTYVIGDRVIYYGIIYESVINDNKIKNPRKWEDASVWNFVTDYQLGQFVNYNSMIYEYIGTQSWFATAGTSSTITPLKDILTNNSFASWLDVTEWKQIDLVPVQTLREYRTGTYSYNFTIDSNIDPFITIEVTSDNGYGQIYTSKKNYEIRGTNDLFGGVKYIEPMGPFEPIPKIVTTIP